ncbi:PAS domain-containing protein [Litoreibacter ponti]|uniref:PAS domain-containing protein n=1 Tax=Litoreibacter ponti TaxID=1510457 RepID=A0A2T6BPY9_9RHOB|nr:PAS-domain containing protein [Litoreibacter ponti]PTX58106.1 PAS domain-containing protein [Litoreibacter ponti]
MNQLSPDDVASIGTIFGFGAIIGVALCVGVVSLLGLRRRSKPSETLEFRFEARELIGACPHARRTLAYEDFDEDVYHQLIDRLADMFPDLPSRLENAPAHHDSFYMTEPTEDGSITVAAELHGSFLTLRISGVAAPLARRVLVESDEMRAAEAELTVLRSTVDATPHPAWRETADGQIDWANRAYLTLMAQADIAADTGAWPPAKLFHGGAVTAPGCEPKVKRSSLPIKGEDARTFEVTRFGIGTSTLNFATDAAATVRAEESLRSFMQTLTQTFAALPIGLAVFDRSRALVMFNPALSDLTRLEPAWLTTRPTLYDVLNELREKRMVPERRDFKDWRQSIEGLVQSASDGTYCETWTLATGQTYRVTGQPHPEGAVAFLLEDITAEMTLTRKFRRELNMSQTLLDNLPNALVVFDSDGVISMQNAAYHALWGTDPEAAMDQITITDASRMWQSASTPDPIWGDARDFVVQRGDRAEWSDTVMLANGRALQCRFQPLSGGATMIEFMPSGDAGAIMPAPAAPAEASAKMAG